RERLLLQDQRRQRGRRERPLERAPRRPGDRPECPGAERRGRRQREHRPFLVEAQLDRRQLDHRLQGLPLQRERQRHPPPPPCPPPFRPHLRPPPIRPSGTAVPTTTRSPPSTRKARARSRTS